MIRHLLLATALLAIASSASPISAKNHRNILLDANGNLDSLITSQAAANGVPEELVRRVIHRESGGNPRVVNGGNYGLMQIKLGTARAMGYTGDAAGLLDPNTNMTYAVRYLAGAYHAAAGNADRAVHYYASGYYYAAKRKSLGESTDMFASVDANGMAVIKNKVPAPGAVGVASSSNLYSGKPDYY